ncbi:MAG: HAD family phosphatase [Myxococcota bacterium]|nr:HAD family phosphatase [Myxococcota bacterium]
MRVRAAVFDMDGTLVDNMRFHGAAWMAFTRRHRLAATLDQFEREYAGKKNEEILPLLFGRSLPAEESRALAEEKEADYRREYAPHLALLPGARELLDLVRSLGLKTAVATAAPPLNRALVVEGLGLQSLFDAIVGPDGATRGKPFPDIFLAAAKAIAVAPGDCVAFEDAVNGVRSAKTAGMFTVGVTTMTSPDALRSAGADAVVGDFTEVLEGPLRALLLGA